MSAKQINLDELITILTEAKAQYGNQLVSFDWEVEVDPLIKNNVTHSLSEDSGDVVLNFV
jgi:hypothetical protein